MVNHHYINQQFGEYVLLFPSIKQSQIQENGGWFWCELESFLQTPLMGSGIQQVFLNKFFGSRRVLDSLCSTVPEEMNQFDEHILQMHPLRSSLVPKHKCDNLTDTIKQRKNSPSCWLVENPRSNQVGSGLTS